MDHLEWEQSYVAEYRALTTFLIDYGFIGSPELMGSVWQELLALRERVLKQPPATDADRAQVEREIDLVLVVHASGPTYRAQLVYRALLQPPIQVCSHMIEVATFHYYKGDYLSCALVLIPAVEAMLRAYTGLPGKTGKPLVTAANERLRTSRPEFDDFAGRRLAYAESIAQFNERWLWKNTKEPDADFRLSHLNRHHALHALGPETFYRARDCHRLFLYFETFSEVLVHEGIGPQDGFVPLEEPALNRRWAYYVRLAENPPSLVEACAAEAALLAEHPFFSQEMHLPRLTGFFAGRRRPAPKP